ncbi:hypothetical protein CCO03_08560 [Comamonas serinivorans]|uniref:HTH cro/C1-type domain-containing protein n=1 Tax=Comamonas serinivorans TaxID=1082851 RepID=A0A1Y0EMT3_9BURK|nr:hypothetical protein CCO03_08560 [Comamonas serinivorans]
MSEDRKTLLGRRLRAARTNARLSQAFVADGLAVTRQTVSGWETGAYSPSATQLAELATMYCVCAHALLFGEPFRAVGFGAFMGQGRALSPN